MIELTLQHSHTHEPTPRQQQLEEYSSQQEQSLKELPCHPHRPGPTFDFSAIEQQIKIIRRKKQRARELAKMAKKVEKSRNELYQADVIEEALEDSIKLVPQFMSLALKQRIKFIEDKVYISAQNDNFGELISRIRQEAISNQALGNGLNLLMSEIQVSIQGDIDEGSYDIHNVQHKKKVIPFQPQPAHRVKLKNMLIRSKIMDLKEEFNQSQIIAQNVGSSSNSLEASRQVMPTKMNIQKFVNRNEGQIWGDEFHLLSEGTRKAQSFVKKIQQEQRKIHVQKVKKSTEMKSLEVKSAMQHKEFEEQMKKQKHQSLKKRYQQGRMVKKSQKQKQEERQKEYIKFIKQYRGKKPLFRIKEEEFQQNVLQLQEKRRKAQLQEIRMAKRPITLEQLQQHQKQYQKLKSEKQAQSNQERTFRKKQIQISPKKEYFRGKFHSLIIQEKEQMKNVIDPQIEREALTKKQRQFGELVRKKYAPIISQDKKKRLQEMIKAIDSQKTRKGLTEQQYKQLGNKYLKQLKVMMDQLRAKGLIKKDSSLPPVSPKKNYLKEVREKYNFSTIDYSSQVESNQDWVASTALKLEKDARHKEKILKLRSQEQFDFQSHMRELQSIHDAYINSAEAKISLINKLQGRKIQKPQKEESDEDGSIKP